MTIHLDIKQSPLGGALVPTIDARQLFEVLGIRTPFPNWIAQKLQVRRLIEGADYLKRKGSPDHPKDQRFCFDRRGLHGRIDYDITVEVAIHFVTHGRSANRAEVLEQLIALKASKPARLVPVSTAYATESQKRVSAPLTMTSLEIASLLGKDHRNVLRDIRTMLNELCSEDRLLKVEQTIKATESYELTADNCHLPGESYQDRLLKFEQTIERPNPKGGKPIKSMIFKLPKRETLILITGYRVAWRAAIIDRWQQLEAQVANPFLTMDRVGLLQYALQSELEKNCHVQHQGCQ